MEALMASIVINNYNYGHFLKETIDSALNQTYPRTEVVVVDDGSTDGSQEIIADYRDRVIPVLTENGGQTSAFNTGFLKSRGEIVCFLDSDDPLLPTAMEKAVNLFLEPDVVKVHWPLWVIDEDGGTIDEVVPLGILPEGNFREVVIHNGPDSVLWPPTSGNTYTRSFLKKFFPLPKARMESKTGRSNADAYLSMLAPLFGRVKRISEPQGYYRIHGQNSGGMRAYERVEADFAASDHRFAVLSEYCRDMGINVDPEVWKQNSWFHQLHQATQEIAALIPPSEALILADQATWLNGEVLADRHAVPFLERDGQYWGPPPDDATAIREFERLRQSGASFMVFAWPAFWWLDYYSGLNNHLRSNFRCVLENVRLVVFDLRP
jgi:hypothetical protein